jgi:hypothetical protein
LALKPLDGVLPLISVRQATHVEAAIRHHACLEGRHDEVLDVTRAVMVGS